jgi:hypothetical protein
MRGNVVENADTLLEVLCDDLFWNMAEPVDHLKDVIRCSADTQ